jgi:hypothetical protein
MANADQTLRGRCHCGNITFDLICSGDGDIPARACDCTFCTKHAGVWTSQPDAKLHVRIQAPDDVSYYEFGTRTARFHVCRRCGVVPVATCELEGRTYAVVNVNAFVDVGTATLRRSPTSFDGEDLATRLARRTRNWISNVHFIRPQP